MKCMICDAEMFFFFKKDDYCEYEDIPQIKNIIPARFFKCSACGLVISETHSSLSADTWHELNAAFHIELENADNFSKKITSHLMWNRH